ncbi:hypothetical protein P3X46_032198 [Hevea brasiliensis]|uniref:Aspartic peptidase DDI1-type domain-containing protein n=1 Tax=Hevea brasiliensis TaxID=3981 RepID=A0ABQ9KCJ4_HEVBR|nr:hypothetical protein P3X46_032198 [Hevea brasiliensis]
MYFPSTRNPSPKIQSPSDQKIMKNIKRPHSNPLAINILMNRYMVQRVLIDTGSSVNLITLRVYEKLGLKKVDHTKVMFPLVKLGDKTVSVAKTMNLIVILGNEVHKRTIYAKFVVVDISLSYNAILGRPILNSNNILINMDCLYLKLLALSGIVVVKRS